jgi:hypothetical protein
LLLASIVSQTRYGEQETVTITKSFYGNRGQLNIKTKFKETVCKFELIHSGQDGSM